MPRHIAATLSLLVALVALGCSGQSSPPANLDGGQDTDAAVDASPGDPAETCPFTIAQEVEYYTTGPQQGRPPDGTLAVGTKVNVLRRTGGYSLVRSADGIEGYILTEAIQDPNAEALP